VAALQDSKLSAASFDATEQFVSTKSLFGHDFTAPRELKMRDIAAEWRTQLTSEKSRRDRAKSKQRLVMLVGKGSGYGRLPWLPPPPPSVGCLGNAPRLAGSTAGLLLSALSSLRCCFTPRSSALMTALANLFGQAPVLSLASVSCNRRRL
jgi:hypothetical protein